AAGMISALMWPHTFTDQRPFFELAIVVSPIFTAVLMYRAGALLRGLGQQPPILTDLRAATLIAIGMSIARIAALS
ncbi:MAG TPA: hypothetical protein VFV51_01545, partial [Vicinamibacterales bacterium]|nr:hypothetical protein [Vicinamibacterales bacterium]